jgi:hypothetical protein
MEFWIDRRLYINLSIKYQNSLDVLFVPKMINKGANDLPIRGRTIQKEIVGKIKMLYHFFLHTKFLTFRLCLGVGFWRGRRGLGRGQPLFGSFKKIRKGFGGFWGAYFIQF